jgi:hypothetical protein
MDLTRAVSEFIDEVLGARGAYSLADIGPLDQPADAVALIRLRVHVLDAYVAVGWTPPPGVLQDMERDRRLLLEADEHAVEPASDVWDATRQMKRAIASRALIELAKGIAMERYQLGPEAAWSWIVRAAERDNVRVRVVAQELVETVSES